MSELFLLNDPTIQQTVDSIRKITVQNPILPLVINKGTIYTWTLIGKVFSVISPSYIFYEGDLFFSLWHGFLYPIDFLCVVFGLLWLIFKNKQLGIFFLSMLIISVFPQIFHKNQENFSGHITLFIPFLIIISSYGCIEFILLFRNKIHKRIMLSILALLYCIFFLNFLHTYFFRYPLGFHTEFDIRTLSYYVESARTGKIKMHILTTNPADLFKKYLYYSNSLQKDSIYSIQKKYIDKNYSIDNISFLPCRSTFTDSNEFATTIIDSGCREDSNTIPFINISSLTDGGTRYKIFNDQICNQYSLKSFPFGITLNDFTIETMPVKQFCETFITKFN